MFSIQSFANVEDYVPPFDVWLEVSNQNAKSAELIYSIALVESGKYVDSNTFIPWPFAIGIGVDESVGQMKHESLYPATFEEASIILNDLLAKGYSNLGVGIMQINILFNSHLVEDPIHLLDPVTNIKAASKVIKQCNRQRSTVEMLSCYSHGRYNSDKGKLYAKRVFEYQDRFAGKFINKHLPMGELTLNELNYFWYQRKASKVEETGSSEVSLIEE